MANMVKTPDELMKILKAATMGDMCFTHILQFIEPGMTEKMVADEIEKTLLGYGAVVDGYCGDMTRTIGIGHLSEEQIKVYDIVLHSQMAGLTACKAGVRCSDVDAASRDIIKEAGYGNYYIHGTGHGVGTEVHEAPTLNPKSEEVLEEYMPVTVEPGIYIPDKFGVRIEDLAIITEFGIINAVKSQKSLIII